ncbi:MAG: glycosyltransferase involved in cell wall biosynthesis [Urechidicola sp.]|jgi:glycosyltransferase involved in cell wall biosynthesis
MHVLILSTNVASPYVINEGIFFADQAKAFCKYGHNVGYVSVHPVPLMLILRKGHQDLGRKEYCLEGVNYLIDSYIKWPKYHLQPMTASLKRGKRLIQAYIEKFGKPDIIHLHTFDAGLLAIWIKETYSIPYVVTEHSSRFLANSIPNQKVMDVARATFENSNLNISVSESFKTAMEQQMNVPFVVIPNIVDTELFTIESFAKKKTKIISIGRLDNNKNQLLVIEALREVKEKFNNIELIIIGKGANDTLLKNNVRELGLSENVVFEGFISRDKIAEIAKTTSLLAITSQHETFGVVAIEAMSAGNLVITTPCGGPEKIISKFGKVSSFNKSKYAQDICQLLNDFSEDQMNASRRYAIENFSEEVVVSKLENVYDSIVQKTKNE